MTQQIFVVITEKGKRGHDKKCDELIQKLEQYGFQYLGYDDKEMAGEPVRIHQFAFDTCETYTDVDGVQRYVSVDDNVVAALLESGIVLRFFHIDQSCKIERKEEPENGESGGNGTENEDIDWSDMEIIMGGK